jgi:membrane protease YdiL (CAAX protease family)
LGWALLAGVLAVVALAGFWIVLFQLVKMPGNTSRFSSLPLATLISALAMASLSGAVTEEAGFRGYFQGTLERYTSAPFAILIAALAMIPEHASTQGFVWPTILFYLVFDAMMGSMAYLTRSILPGTAIHFVGLMTFFGLIWPNDRARARVLEAGTDIWFFIHLCQALIFAVLSLWAFRHLAKASVRWFPRKTENTA